LILISFKHTCLGATYNEIECRTNNATKSKAGINCNPQERVIEKVEGFVHSIIPDTHDDLRGRNMTKSRLFEHISTSDIFFPINQLFRLISKLKSFLFRDIPKDAQVQKHRYIEIGKKSAEAILTSVVILDGALTLADGLHSVISEYRARQDRKNFAEDSSILTHLREDGYVSRLKILERAKFEKQAKAAIDRLEKINPIAAELYHKYYAAQFSDKT
jgi:hypothetical protein